MEEVVSQSVAWRETPMRLLSGFALFGLLLAGIGVYSVLAYYVSQRNRELGIRVALGASKRTLISLVLRQSAVPLALGIGLGVAGAIASGAARRSALRGPARRSARAHVDRVAADGCALLSSWLPARRAAMVDPVVALREE